MNTKHTPGLAANSVQPSTPALRSLSPAVRIGSLLSASAITAVTVGTQLGIAENYTAQADAKAAAAQSPNVALGVPRLAASAPLQGKS